MEVDRVLAELESVERQLEAELEGHPTYRMLKEVRDLIDTRRAMIGQSKVPETHIGEGRNRSSPRSGSRAAQVVELAKEFLRQKGSRAQSKDVLNFLEHQGVDFGSASDRVATVASYLSTAKDVFDNVKGEGYGLVSWRVPRGLLPDQVIPGRTEGEMRE